MCSQAQTRSGLWLRGLAAAAVSLMALAWPAKARADGPDAEGPELHIVEFGLGAGLVSFSRVHGLYRPGEGKHEPFVRPMGELVVRGGYYPLRFVGVELAGRLIPGRVESHTPATAYSIRAQVVGQLHYRFTPFVVGGVELLGVSSVDALGKDLDVGGHVGGGLKFYVTPRFALRLGVVGMFHERLGPGNTAHVEADLGLTMVLRRRSAGHRLPQ